MEASVQYGKQVAKSLHDYVEEEGEQLLASFPLEADRLSAYIGVLISLNGIICFLKDCSKERITLKRDACRLQGISLQEEKRRLEEMEALCHSFNSIVDLWCPSDKLEKERIDLQAQGHNSMLSIVAQTVACSNNIKTVPPVKDPPLPPSLPLTQLAPGPAPSTPESQAQPLTLHFPDSARDSVDSSALVYHKYNSSATYSAESGFSTDHERRGRGRKGKAPAASMLTFHPRREAYYDKEEWQKRLAKVSRCSSVGEVLRLFIGTEMLPAHTPMNPSALEAFGKEQLLQTSQKTSPLWSCSFSLPVTAENKYIFPEGACADAQGFCYVTRTKAYTKKQKSKQIAFFRAAMTLYPDETAYYCTLQRSDLNIAEEAKESPFDFTNAAYPLTEQVVAAFTEDVAMEVTWSLEQAFPSVDALLPDGYVVRCACGPDVYECQGGDSVVSAFVGAMIKAEERRGRGNNTIAMWTEFAHAKPPVMNTGREATVYLFDHFFGVQAGRESALDIGYTAEGNQWRATVKLRYALAHNNTVTIATAAAFTKREAEDLALRSAAAHNFHEVFSRIAEADATKVSKVAIQYAQEIMQMRGD